jgi:phage gp36-like protein
MSYATREALIDRYGEPELVRLTDVDRLGVVDEGKLSAAIESTNAMVDAYLSGAGYSLPLTPMDASIVDAACAIVRFKLFRYEAVPEAIEAKDAAIDYLTRISKGTVSLVGQSDAPKSAAAGSMTYRFAGTEQEAIYGRYLD